jgi:hypothetical protein
MNSAETTWVQMIAIHAAKHVAAGKSEAEAVALGMADYTAQLNSMIVARRVFSGDRSYVAHEVHPVFVAKLCAASHADVNGGAR